jgi:hypothetical protein
MRNAPGHHRGRARGPAYRGHRELPDRRPGGLQDSCQGADEPPAGLSGRGRQPADRQSRRSGRDEVHPCGLIKPPVVGLKRVAKPQAQYWNGARQDRLVLDWIWNHLSADQEIRGDLLTLRGRAREAIRNDGWAKRYVRLMVKNVIGPRGVQLQARLVRGTNNLPNDEANDKIEAAWARWGKRGTPTADGKYSWLGVQRQVMKGLATDGEVLIRILRGFDNDFGFALAVPGSRSARRDVQPDRADPGSMRSGWASRWTPGIGRSPTTSGAHTPASRAAVSDRPLPAADIIHSGSRSRESDARRAVDGAGPARPPHAERLLRGRARGVARGGGQGRLLRPEG